MEKQTNKCQQKHNLFVQVIKDKIFAEDFGDVQNNLAYLKIPGSPEFFNLLYGHEGNIEFLSNS